MKSFLQIVKGILLRGEATDPTDNKEGSLWVNSVSNRLKGYLQGSVRTVVTEDQTQTLSNKTLTTPTIVDFSNAQHDHADADDGGLLSHLNLTDIGTNTHAQIDTHIGASTGVHGVSGSVVGTTDSQILTNKTIDGDDNIVQDLALTSLKTVLADANKIIQRDASGIVVSASSLPSGTSATFSDSLLTIQDNGDPTKQLKFEASSITAGQTRILTAPNASTTIVGTDVGQILTNKTIDATNNTISNIANANIATGAGIALNKLTTIGNGNIIVGNGSGIPTDTAMSGAITISNAGITAYTGTVPLNKGGTGQTTQTDAFDALAPNTTKGDIIVYNGTDNIRVGVGTNDQVLTADSAAASGVKWADGGSGSGRVNFLTSNDTNFKNSIGNWVAFKDAAATTPADLTGGSPTVMSIARGTTFDSTGNARISHTAANGQGEGVSVSFTVEPEYRASMMDIEFNYVTSAAYADDKLELWIYDITNTTLVQPVPYQLKASLTPTKFKAQFQTSSTGASYRIGFFCGNTTATAYDIDIDNVIVGPTIYNYGLVGTDFKTMTGFTSSLTTNTTLTVIGRRIGDQLECYAKMAFSGAPNAATNPILTLPAGMSIDTAKIIDTSGGNTTIGSVSFSDSGVASYAGEVAYTSATSIEWQYFNAAGSGDKGSFAGATSVTPFTVASGDKFIAYFKIPILGWSSNVQMSDSADLRLLTARYGAPSGSQTITGSTDIINFSSRNYDTHSVVSTGAAWKFTAPSTGYYDYKGKVQLSNSTANYTINLYRYKNGSTDIQIARYTTKQMDTDNNDISLNFADQVFLTAGDYIDFRIDQSSGSGIALANDGVSNTWVSITKVQGPSAIAATETIACKIGNASGITFSNSVDKTIIFATKHYDTHNAYNTSTGLWTAPAAGLYLFSYGLYLNGFTAAADDRFVAIYLYKNSVATELGGMNSYARTTASIVHQIHHTTPLRLNAGDTIEMHGLQNLGSTPVITSNIDYGFFSAQRIGL